MKQSTMQDKGVSPTAAMSQGFHKAGVTIEETMDKAGATISAQVDKLKAGDEEERMQADLTKDKRQADAEDRAEAKKAQHQHHEQEQQHPPPFTKTPFV